MTERQFEMTTKKPKLPIILYEEPLPGEPANPIPYIEVGIDDEMPKVLFIQQYKETGDFEITSEGQVAIVDMLIHKFVDLEHLKFVLKPKEYDKVRVALGMKPLKQAQKFGKKTFDRALKEAEKRRDQLLQDSEARKERAFVLGEDLRIKAERFLEERKQNKEEE